MKQGSFFYSALATATSSRNEESAAGYQRENCRGLAMPILEHPVHGQHAPDEGSCVGERPRRPGHAGSAAGCRRESPLEELRRTFDRSFLEQRVHHRRGRRQRRRPRAQGHAGGPGRLPAGKFNRGAATDVWPCISGAAGASPACSRRGRRRPRAPGHAGAAAECRRESLIEELQRTLGHAFLEQLLPYRRVPDEGSGGGHERQDTREPLQAAGGKVRSGSCSVRLTITPGAASCINGVFRTKVAAPAEATNPRTRGSRRRLPAGKSARGAAAFV